jgi:hypothetical protein
MDIYKVIFRILLAVVIIYPNYIFFKGLKISKKKYFKYKLLYFLISVIIPCALISLVALIMTSPALNQLINLKIDPKNLTSRIIVGSIIFPPSILLNIIISKFYLKRIFKPKSKNEIELIGKE